MSKSENSTSAGRVDQIREIIFGEQIRDYDSRFAELERRFAERLEGITTQLDEVNAKKHASVERQISKLEDKLKEERTARSAAVKEATKELTAALRSVEEASSGSSGELKKTLSGLEGELKKSVQRLEKAIEKQGSSMADSLDEHVGRLDGDKVDRSALAQLFAGLAEQLSGGNGS